MADANAPQISASLLFDKIFFTFQSCYVLKFSLCRAFATKPSAQEAKCFCSSLTTLQRLTGLAVVNGSAEMSIPLGENNYQIIGTWRGAAERRMSNLEKE